MQQQQKQLQIKNYLSINSKSAKKQTLIVKNESQCELQQKNDQIYIPQNCYSCLKKNKEIKVNRLRWTPKQNHLYKEFLEQNINLMEADFHHRMTNKINVLMSQHIETKSSNQCRSHHQKMMISHKDVARIIKFIEDIQHGQTPLEINPRKQEVGLQSLLKKGSFQQMNQKEAGGESFDMVKTQPIFQLREQIVIHQLTDIPTIVMEVNMVNCDPYNIQQYFQPEVWWDGSQI